MKLMMRGRGRERRSGGGIWRRTDLFGRGVVVVVSALPLHPDAIHPITWRSSLLKAGHVVDQIDQRPQISRRYADLPVEKAVSPTCILHVEKFLLYPVQL